MKTQKHLLFWFLLPSLSGLLFFYCIPFVLSLYYALINNMGDKNYVGLQNFAETLQNPVFQQGLKNTICFMLISVPILMSLSLLLALSLQKMNKGKTLVILVFLLPLIIPSGTITYFWKCIFDNNGFLNKLLYSYANIVINWGNSKWALAIAVIIFLWKNIGLCTIVFLVGLNRIPKEYYEIAKSEGASKWQCFRYITLIYLTPTCLTVLLLAIFNSFKTFKEIYILYGSYPSKHIYMIQHYISNQFLSLNMQKLTSASYILFFIVVVLVLTLVSMQKKLAYKFTNLHLSPISILYKKSRKLVNPAIALTFLIILLPVLFLFSNSLMSSKEVFHRYTTNITAYNMFDIAKNSMHFVRIGLLPDVITLNQYFQLLFKSPTYLRLYWNSIIIVVPIVLGQCLISPLAAFAFERMKWKCKEVLFFIYILTMLMPIQILLVPHYLVANCFGFTNNYLAIILPAIFNPLGVFLIRQQLKGFPKDCIEAAQSCGATEWQIFSKVVLPNLKASLVSLAVITFAEYWNVVDQAVVFIKSPNSEPLSIYLSRIMEVDSGIFFATSCFYLLPAISVFSIGASSLQSNK